MQVYTEYAEEQLAAKLKRVQLSVIGWWVASMDPKDGHGERLFRDKKKLKTAVSIIKETIGDEENIDLYICTNGCFILIGKGVRNKRIALLKDLLESVLNEGDDADAGKEPLTFTNVFFDLSSELDVFYKFFAHILAKCEVIQDKKENELLIPKQNLFPALERNQIETLNTLRLRRQNLSVMCIEDDRTTISLLRQLIGSINNTATLNFADNAHAGVNLYFNVAPDILFLDINLPDGSGLEILEFLHSNDKQNHTIMLTAESSVQIVQKALALGAKGFVKKPFSRKQFDDIFKKIKPSGR